MLRFCLPISRVLFGVYLILGSILVHAETTPGGTQTDTQSHVDVATLAPPPSIPVTLASPRATMETFLHSMNDIKRGQPERINDALSTLDLSDINPLVHKEKGNDLAWILLEVMDRTAVVDLKKVPKHEEGGDYIFHQYTQGDIRISRMDDGRWLFNKKSLDHLQSILDGLASSKKVTDSAKGEEETTYLPMYLRIRGEVPEPFKKPVLVLEVWQWLGIFLIVLTGVIADKVLGIILKVVMRMWLSRHRGSHYSDLSPDLLRPFGLMAMAAIWWVGLNMLGLPEAALLVLLLAAKFIASFSAVWGIYRLVDMVSAYFQERASKTETRLDDVLVPLFTRVSKVFVTVIGIVFLADNMNMDITGVLAGLGLGGLAFALAAKDAVENFFGSVTVLVDRSFTVGDWVIVGDVEGTVEKIGFRSTRIRTFYDSLVTVPNSRFITASVDNMGMRGHRRFKGVFALAYETPPEKVESYCEGLRQLVHLHPYTRKDYFHIYLNELGTSSIDVLVYIFFTVPDWGTELRERHRFLLDAVRLAERLGVAFAYPTQTLYWKKATEAQPPETPEFHPDMSQRKAFGIGRNEAEAIVRNTVGLGIKPPPVGSVAGGDE